MIILLMVIIGQQVDCITGGTYFRKRATQTSGCVTAQVGLFWIVTNTENIEANTNMGWLKSKAAGLGHPSLAREWQFLEDKPGGSEWVDRPAELSGCELCGIEIFNSEISREEHLRGKRHANARSQNMLTRSETAGDKAREGNQGGVATGAAANVLGSSLGSLGARAADAPGSSSSSSLGARSFTGRLSNFPAWMKKFPPPLAD